jgi:hypothetical protein
MFRDKTGASSKERKFSAWKASQRSLAGKDLAVDKVMSGMQRGLNKYCGSIRIALLLAVKEEDPLVLYDHNGLLQPHRQRLKEIYSSSAAWKEPSQPLRKNTDEELSMLRDIKLPGVISKGASSASVFYQRWFVERVPNLAHDGPIYSWLEDASFELAAGLEPTEKDWNNYTYAELADNALTAVVGYLYQAEESMMEKRGLRLPNPFPVIDAVSRISIAREEGERASGKIMFIERSQLEHHMKYHLELDGSQDADESLPSLLNTKHVRKLLTLCGKERSLLSDGEYIRGIADLREPTPENCIIAEFRHGRGEIKLGSQLICTFADGELYGDSGSADLSDLNRVLLNRAIEPHLRERLARCVEVILNSAKQTRYGCSLIIDFHQPARRLPGEYLREPINSVTNGDLVAAMARIDGALHLTPRAELIGFACLLDGDASPNEDRSRGARYNSGLRFSAKKGEQETIVIAVSADGPISIFERGIDITSSAHAPTEDVERVAVPLTDWLKKKS